jgi:hypothetical protein
MTKSQADGIFKILRKMGCSSVHIGGGEPFINFDSLREVCISAGENGMVIDYIETNASWVINERRACANLYKLLDADVSCLLISLDPFHNEFVPLERIKSLIKCCRKTGMQTFIWQTQFEKFVSQFDTSTTHALSEYTKKYGAEFVPSAMKSYGLGINGRSIKLADMYYEPHSAEYYLQRNDLCGSIISTRHFHVDANGNYIPPGCIGFQVNLNDMQSILSADKYANFLEVVSGGLKLLYKRALSLGFVPKQEGYSHKCALCYDIKKYILNKTNAADIGPNDFFDEY